MPHDLFLLQLTFGLELLYDARLLREIGVADLAIDQRCLMPGMGKRNITPFAPWQDHLFSASFFNGKRTGCADQEHGKQESGIFNIQGTELEEE